MKNKKKIFGLLVLAVLIVAVALTVVAETAPEYTGNVTTMNAKLGIIDAAADFDSKLSAADDALYYLGTVDPATAGYADLVAALDARELAIADEYVDVALAEAAAADKHKSLDGLTAWLAEHTFAPNEALNAELALAKTKIAEAYLEESVLATTAADKHLVLDGLASFVSAYAPATSEIYTAEAVEAENFACAGLYLAEVNASQGLSKSGAALRRLRGFMADHPFSDNVAGYASFSTSLTQKTATYDAAVAKAKEALERQAHVSDYSKNPIINLDFNGAAEGGISINRLGSLVPENYLDGEVAHSLVGEDAGLDGTNGYYTIQFNKASTHTRTNATIPTTITDSLVFEFDVTTFDRLPENDIVFENGTKAVNGANLPRTYMKIAKTTGNILNSAGTVVVEGAITPGQWVHIAFVLDQVTNNLDLYVDYELVSSTSLAHSSGYTNVFERIRIGSTPPSAGGSIALDNVKLYQGFAPRANDSYKSFTNEEKFVYCTELVTDGSLPMATRLGYYDEASKYIGSYWDGMTYRTSNVAVRSAVDAYLAFTDTGYESLLDSHLKANLALLKERVAKVTSFDIGEKTYNDRVFFLEVANSFVSANGTQIEKGEAYDECMDALLKVSYQLQKEDSLLGFINAVNNFYAAATIDLMKSYYKLANDNLAVTDLNMATSGKFPSFDAAYALYLDMDEVMADEITIDNSKLLAACLRYLLPYKTAEEWDANYDELKVYVTTARDIITAGDYDANYSNLAEMLVQFVPMNEYFYTKLQNDHISHITLELGRYAESDAYFERFGIISELKNYTEVNELDLTNTTILALIANIDEEYAKVMTERENYSALLASNTEKFIETCKGLVGAISYTEMKRLCDEAAAYYYAMNVMSAEAQDAIAVYSSRRDEIELIEENAKSFVLAVGVFGTPDTDALENILLVSEYVTLLEESCEGVSDALARYNNEIAIFNAGVEKANAEIADTVTAATALMNNGERSALVTVILDDVSKK